MAGLLISLASTIHTWNLESEDQLGILNISVFILVFPLFFGAMAILQKRKEGKYKMDWTKVLFKYLPSSAIQSFHVFSWIIVLFIVWVMIANRRDYPTFGISEMIGFSLIPSMFFATCTMAYWSAKNESKHNKALGENSEPLRDSESSSSTL